MGALNSVFESPYLGFGMSAIGTGMQTAAAYRDAQAQNYANQVNAMSYEQEAELATIQAAKLREHGAIAAEDVRREYVSLAGNQRAAYGASGVAVNAGSAAAVVANTAAEGVYESAKTKYQYELDAWSKDREAANLRFKATTTRNSSVNPWVNASTAAIGGLTKTYSTLSKVRST